MNGSFEFQLKVVDKKKKKSFQIYPKPATVLNNVRLIIYPFPYKRLVTTCTNKQDILIPYNVVLNYKVVLVNLR